MIRKSVILLLTLLIIVQPSYAKTNKAAFQSQKDFVKTMYPYAQKAAKKIGLDPKVLIAQAAHETNWGKRIPKRQDGSSSHNLFGIKATSSNKKTHAISKTKEYQKGKMIRIKAGFRTYDNFEASFEDYVAMLQRAKRYESALSNTHKPYNFLKQLQSAGYATDPKYAQKIYNIYRSTHLGV